MSYYNPRFYNYKNLNHDDQHYVDGMFHIRDLLDSNRVEFEYKYNQNESRESNFINAVFSDTANQVIDISLMHIESEIIQFIVSRIDDYDHDVEEQNADNHFYGREVSTNG